MNKYAAIGLVTVGDDDVFEGDATKNVKILLTAP